MKRSHGIAAAAAFAALAAGASLVAAQPPFRERGDRAALGRLERAADFLDLTDAQRQQAKDLVEQARPNQERIRERLREHGERLRELLDGENPDPTAVGEAMIAMHRLREESRAARESLETIFEALLTPEQMRKWEMLEASRITGGPGPRGHRRGRGPRPDRDPDER